MTSLTPRNRSILAWIREFHTENHYFPTYREICKGFGFASPAPAQHHIGKLKDAGLITGDSKKARTLRLVDEKPDGIPISGVIAAGGFVEVFSDSEVKSIPPNLFSQNAHGLERFALRVRGDSMIGADILDNDVVILDKPPFPREVKNKTIVAARVDGENQTTLKRWHREGNQVFLVPENSSYPTIQIESHRVVVEGVYVGLIRGIV